MELEKITGIFNLKYLISSLIILITCSCSSLQETKPLESTISSNAYSFLNAAEKMRTEGKYREAIEYYNRASSEFISKLLYKKFALSQLKKVMILIKLKRFEESLNAISFIKFCDLKFDLKLSDEIKGVELRYLVAKGDTQNALEKLDMLLKNKDLSLERKSYFNSILLRLDPSRVDRNQMKKNFRTLFESYQVGKLQNHEGLIYMGQGILDDSSDFEASIFSKLKVVATDREIKRLSIYLLNYQKRFAAEAEQEYLQRLIDFMK